MNFELKVTGDGKVPEKPGKTENKQSKVPHGEFKPGFRKILDKKQKDHVDEAEALNPDDDVALEEEIYSQEGIPDSKPRRSEFAPTKGKSSLQDQEVASRFNDVRRRLESNDDGLAPVDPDEGSQEDSLTLDDLASMTTEEIQTPNSPSITSSLNPEMGITPSLNPEMGITPSLNPEMGITPSLNPEMGVTPSLNPEMGVTPSLNPEMGVTSSLNPEMGITPSLNPEIGVTSSLNPEMSQGINQGVNQGTGQRISQGTGLSNPVLGQGRGRNDQANQVAQDDRRSDRSGQFLSAQTLGDNRQAPPTGRSERTSFESRQTLADQRRDSTGFIAQPSASTRDMPDSTRFTGQSASADARPRHIHSHNTHTTHPRSSPFDSGSSASSPMAPRSTESSPRQDITLSSRSRDEFSRTDSSRYERRSDAVVRDTSQAVTSNTRNDQPTDQISRETRRSDIVSRDERVSAVVLKEDDSAQTLPNTAQTATVPGNLDLKPAKDNTQDVAAFEDVEDLSDIDDLFDNEEVLVAPGKTEPRAQVLADLMQSPLVQTFQAAPTETTSGVSNAQTMADLVTSMVQQISQVSFSDRTETLVTLVHPPVFEGAQVIIREFNQAKGEFSVSFHDLSPQASALLLERTNQRLLQDGFERRGLTIHILQVSQAPITETYFTSGDQRGSFRENDREGDSKDKGSDGQRDRRQR